MDVEPTNQQTQSGRRPNSAAAAASLAGVALLLCTLPAASAALATGPPAVDTFGHPTGICWYFTPDRQDPPAGADNHSGGYVVYFPSVDMAGTGGNPSSGMGTQHVGYASSCNDSPA